MILLKIDRKLLGLVLIYSMFAFLGFRAFQYVWNISYEDMDRPVVSDEVSRYSGSSLVAFLVSAGNQEIRQQNVEIFDIEQGKVVKRVGMSPDVQKLAEKYLEGITGMYVKANAFPDKGYIVRIPLKPPVTVQNHWLASTVRELFVLFPEGTEPYLLVLDEKSRPLFFTFEGETGTLLKLLQFEQSF